MPELPDVEIFRRYIQSTALHKKIRNVRVLDTAVLENISAAALEEELKGHSFEQAERHGKYCLLILDNTKNLVLHFGMTGFVKYYKIKDQAPKHVRAAFEFDNDYTLAYDSQRKLGEVALAESVLRFIEDRKLGPDAMAPDFSDHDFLKCLKGRRGTLKSALMNQKIIAGIGNVYSDEILFQEKIHPTTKITDLDDEQLRRVFTTMRQILIQVIDSGIEPQEMPHSLLTHHRRRDMKCPSCRGDIKKIKVAGRSAYFCPSCQTKVGK
jgi:formamidopyrimidine-DNA glycosylase